MTTIWDVAMALVLCGAVLAGALGLIGSIWNANVTWTAQQKSLAETCISNGGSWVPQNSQGMCLARGTSTHQ